MSLYHYRARMYDVVAGRFVGRDPIGFVGSLWNLFGFIGSGPLNTNDPSGLAPILPPRFDDCFAGHFAVMFVEIFHPSNIQKPAQIDHQPLNSEKNHTY